MPLQTDEASATERAPRCLLVVGAAAGMGRWLTEHVFSQRPWDGVVLVDTAESADALRAFRPAFDCPVAKAAVGADGEVVGLDGGPTPDVGVAGTAACVAVPRDALAGVAGWLLPRLGQGASVCGVAPTLVPTLAALAPPDGAHAVYGAHPLFDASARSLDGQTIVIAPDEGGAHQWLADAIVAGGGLVKLLAAPDHDRTMSYVQTMAHQSLLGFVDAVARSGLDLQEVWEARTPLFEALFGLATRAIGERQQATVADIQVSTDGERVAAELRQASVRLDAALAAGSAAAVEKLITEVRDRFSGALFETVQATAVAAVTAAQAKRAELATRARTGALLGVRPVGRADALRVGRIVEVTPTAVTLREVMVGPKGEATLLEGPGRRNAGRVGKGGKPKHTVFALGHIELVLGDELEAALDDWLVHIRRDVRFLVPESVAGAGVLAVVASHRGIRAPELVSEVVRTGQRAVVVRVWIRADHDVDDMVEALRALVQATYIWPRGLSLPASGVDRVHYLGPAGTFSEVAARQAVASVGLSDAGATVEPRESFESVLAGVDERALAILPISSSASGLVPRAAAALLDHPGEMLAGGVVDVAVRFDAYVQEPRQLTELRGAKVFSHPNGLAQCQGFIRRWELEPVACSSTAEALRVVAERDEPAVALAGAESGAAWGLKVAEREVDDLSGSITRFLILGAPGTFGELVGGSDPTLRSIWVCPSVPGLTAAGAGEPAFDELLTSVDGQCLWVTSRTTDANAVGPGARYLGKAPWSPRTPVVRVVTVPSG